MSEQAYRKLIAGESPGMLGMAARLGLRILSVPYAVVTAVRNRAFDAGLKATVQVKVPVIAIGNLTTGGTGKTPVVATVVKILQELGQQPGIVSRGYGADETGENDEKRVLQQLCPGIPHEQNPDRVAAAEKLIQRENISVIVLDDAFQHRRIARDLNIVLIDATNPFGYGYQLPRGLLRESLSGLKRANLVLITRADATSNHTLAHIEATVSRHNPALAGRIFRVSFRPTGLLSPAGQQPLSDVQDQPVTVLTAIGNPGAFLNTCRRIGADIVTSMFFSDHHHYTEKDLKQVQQHAGNAGAPLILTTLKDFVKIPPGHENIMAVQIDTVFGSDAGEQFVRDELASVF